MFLRENHLRSYHKFLKLNGGNFFIKALKLVHQFEFLELFIPQTFSGAYSYDKHGHDNEIFNLFLISQFLMINIDYKISSRENEYMYSNIIYLAFDDVSDYLDVEDYRNINFFISAAYKFCRINDCKKEILKEIQSDKLMSILLENKSNNRIN